MSKQELLNLIHQSVCDSSKCYEAETINVFNSLINTFQLSKNEQADTLNEALFNYTMSISESTCIAMAKCLISAGILNISEEDV